MAIAKVGIRERRASRPLGYAAIAAMAVFVCADAQAVVTSKSYIQSGLVAHWDAIENAGYGQHDDATNMWTDLKGYCDLTIVDADSSWTDNSFVPPQKSYYAAARDEGDSARISYSTYRSIDACLTRKYYSDGKAVVGMSSRLISWQKDGFICRGAKDRTCHATLVTDTPYSIYAAYESGNATVITNYIDGVPVVEEDQEKRTALTTTARFQIGRDYLNNYWSSTAPVHSVRLYSRVLEPWEILVNSNVDQIRYRGVDGTTLTWPEGMRFADDSVEYRVATATTATFLPVGGAETNKISVNGGEPAAFVTAWKPVEGSCTLTPVPDANHRFVCWTGDMDGLSVGVDGSIELDGQVRSLTCHFVPKTFPTVAKTWTDESGDGDWATAGNWSPSGAPAEYDIVTVPAGQTATLATGGDSPNYLSVECAGTLVLSNWTTRLRAMSNVRVFDGGVLTCGAAATNMEAMSRVWVACSNLSVDAGGKIDVTRKGFYGQVGVTKRGFGPGSAPDGMTAGIYGGYAAPSHGGYGGWYLTTEYCYQRLLPYDDPAAPSLPGSSGAANDQSYGGDGGGVVRIEATGAVTVNGSILADGRNAASYGGNGSGSSHGQPGAGGSIWITCGTISGSGTIRAAGGGGDNPLALSSVPAAPAGGGMIAIDYDASRQTAEAVEGMTISAAAGLYKTSKFVSTCFNADTNHWGADIGTLHFTDAKIVDALLGKSLTGQIRDLPSYTYDGDLVFTNGHVRFADIGVAVTVGGNLTLGGDGVARLEVGGCIATNRYTYTDLYAGTTPCSLAVGGDLTLGGKSRLDIRAAATNGVDAFGAVVSVGGAMTIGSNCIVTASSDLRNLGAPKFEVGSLFVATGGLFTAAERGGRGGYGYHVAGGVKGVGLGVGPGSHDTYSTPGASHGGRGGGSSKATYGSESRPLLPGSGGGCYSHRVVGGAGGGLVYVSATNGTISIDGVVNADAGTSAKKGGESRVWGYGGGASGGAILLESRFFRLGETGVLTARGGASQPYTTVESATGGGGRIAVWCGGPWRADLRRNMYKTSNEPFADPDALQWFAWEGAANVDAGELDRTYVDKDSLLGKPGTVFFGFVRDQPYGLSLILK